MKNMENRQILDMCPSIANKTFQPSPLAPTCLLQTAAASILVKKNNNIDFLSEKVLYIDTHKDTGLRILWP